MADEARYWKTENGAVFFEAPDKGMTFDVPESHLTEKGTFVIDESCECYLVTPDPEEPLERVFIARKENRVLAIGMEDDMEGNADITYTTILEIKEARH